MQPAPSEADGGALTLVLLFLAVLYFVPTVVAAVKKVPNLRSVVVLNVFLGWTVVGWVAALAMASRIVTPRVLRRLVTR